MAAAIPGVQNMTRPSPKRNLGPLGARLDYALHTTGIVAVVLFLFLSLTRAWPQETGPNPSGSADDQTTQQLGSTGDSATEPEVATESKPQTAAPTSAPDPALPDQKTNHSEGKQTKRMFWVIPNFAAVSAHTELPPFPFGISSCLRRTIVWIIRPSCGQDYSLAKAWL